jgi:hypothetical protein
MTKRKVHRKYSVKNIEQIPEIRAAIDYGIDVTMLIDNIHRTPSERVRRHQIALATVEMLRKAKRV